MLASRVSAEPVTGITRGKFEQPAPLVALSVSRLPVREASAAANAYAALLAKYFSSYVDEKMKTYEIRLKRLDQRVIATRKTLADAQAQSTAVVDNHSLPESEKRAIASRLWECVGGLGWADAREPGARRLPPTD